jgi:hypothetical protein
VRALVLVRCVRMRVLWERYRLRVVCVCACVVGEVSAAHMRGDPTQACRDGQGQAAMHATTMTENIKGGGGGGGAHRCPRPSLARVNVCAMNQADHAEKWCKKT